VTSVSSFRSVLRVWFLALAMSAALVVAGQRWPATLPIRQAAVWALVLVPPSVMLLVLLAGWFLPPPEAAAAADSRSLGSPPGQGGESDPSNRENG